jgi:hypothetical protein
MERMAGASNHSKRLSLRISGGWTGFPILLLTALSVLLASTAPAGAASKTEVKARVLSLSNMPAGWSIDHTSGSSGEIACLNRIKAPHKGEVKATVSYRDGSFPGFQEVVVASSQEDKSYTTIVKCLSACRNFHYTADDGLKITGTISAMSFPAVGTRSSAFALDITVQGVTAGADVVIFEAGRYEGAVIYENLGNPDPSQAQAFIKEAVAKVEGKPAVTPPAVTTPTSPTQASLAASAT